MSTYDVTVTREDDLWVAVAIRDEVDREALQALDFVQFSDMRQTMPEYIADMTGDDDVAVRWHYNIGERDLTMEMTAMIDSAGRLKRAQAEQEAARAVVLAALRSAGLSQRTIAEVLGVSHQRVNQLLQAS